MSRILGYFTPVRAYSSAGEIYMQAASGRVAEALAMHYEKVYVCARVVYGAPPAPFDAPLNAPNIELVAQPFWGTTVESLIHFFGIARAYLRTYRRADVLFVRGGCPYTAILYFYAAILRKPICHWIFIDPVTLLRERSKSFRARWGRVSFFLAPIPAEGQSCESFLWASCARRKESSICWTRSRSSG